MSKAIERENKDILQFIIFTFMFSWILWLPSLLASLGFFKTLPLFNFLMAIGSFGPFIAGFILTYLNKGFEGVKDLWKRGWHCDEKVFLLIALILIPILSGISLLLANISNGFELPELQIQGKYGYLFAEILMIFFIGGPFQEEFGWRGYILDSLQSQWNALESSILLGGIWGIWHFPLFFISGTPYLNQSFFSFTISIISISILFTWLHNNTNGSILVAMIFHTVINISYIIFLQNISFIVGLYFNLLIDISIIIILIVYGPKNLNRIKIKKIL